MAGGLEVGADAGGQGAFSLKGTATAEMSIRYRGALRASAEPMARCCALVVAAIQDELDGFR